MSFAVAVVIAAFALFAATDIGFYLSLKRYSDSARWIEHTHIVIQLADKALADLSTAESAQRGYLLTGDASYLDSFNLALAAVPAEIEQLVQATRDNPAQLERIEHMKTLFEQRAMQLNGFIEARRAGLAAPHAQAALSPGRNTMEAFRDLVAMVTTTERTLLRARSDSLERDRDRTTLLNVMGDVTAFAFLLFSLLAMRLHIVERTRMEERTRLHAAEVEDLYNNAPCGYQSLDSNGIVLRVNDTLLSWLGFSRAELVGKFSMRDLLTPESREVFDETFAEFRNAGFVHDIEYDFVRKDGSVLPVSLSATAIRNAAGEFVTGRATLFDISERRRAERELQRTNLFIDSIIEHLPNMIFVKRASDLRFVRMNRAGEQLIGVERDALMGKNDYDLFPREQADFFTRTDRQVLADGKLVDIPVEPLQTSSGVRILHTKKIPLADAQGPTYLVGISEDVTEREEAQRKIVELNRALEARAEQLETSNRELESFSYSVSHDLRSPLRAIDGFTQILQEDYASRLDDEGRRLLSVVRQNSLRMAHLIDDLLAFSRLGRHPLTEGNVDMNELVREAYAEVHGSERNAVQLELHALPNCRGDRMMLRQVWINLLSNAVKYSSKRERPQVTVSGAREAGNVIFKIEDNGVGFDMRYVDKLFGVFQRLHRAEEFPGTGVGLAIVQRVVERHGGKAWAEGALDRGSTFYFSLPERTEHGSAAG